MNLNCLNCKNRFDIPLVLPCGHLICQNCIDTKFNYAQFRCPYCKDVHSLLYNGLPIHKETLNKLEKDEYKLIENSIYARFEFLTNHLHENFQIEKNKRPIHRGNANIVQQLHELKNKIDMHSNHAIDSIELLRDLTKSEIDEFIKEKSRNRCSRNLNATSSNRISSSTLHHNSLADEVKCREFDFRRMKFTFNNAQHINDIYKIPGCDKKFIVYLEPFYYTEKSHIQKVNLQTGEVLNEISIENSNSVRKICFSQEYMAILLKLPYKRGQSPKRKRKFELRLYAIDTFAFVKKLEFDYEITSCCIDEKATLFVSSNSKIYLYNLPDLNKVNSFELNFNEYRSMKMKFESFFKYEFFARSNRIYFQDQQNVVCVLERNESDEWKLKKKLNINFEMLYVDAHMQVYGLDARRNELVIIDDSSKVVNRISLNGLCRNVSSIAVSPDCNFIYLNDFKNFKMHEIKIINHSSNENSSV